MTTLIKAKLAVMEFTQKRHLSVSLEYNDDFIPFRRSDY